jgi:hypothetical protein
LPGPAACPRGADLALTVRVGHPSKGLFVGSVIKKRRKRMAKKKHRKLLKKTRVQRRKLGK